MKLISLYDKDGVKVLEFAANLEGDDFIFQLTEPITTELEKIVVKKPESD
jgi:hypothetical protein